MPRCSCRAARQRLAARVVQAANPGLLLQHVGLLLQGWVRLAAVQQGPASGPWRLLVQALQRLMAGREQQQLVLGRLQQRPLLVGLPSAGGWLAVQHHQQPRGASCRCSSQLLLLQVLMLVVVVMVVVMQVLLARVARLLMVQARRRAAAKGCRGSGHMQRRWRSRSSSTSSCSRRCQHTCKPVSATCATRVLRKL